MPNFIEQLREEWLKESTHVGANIPDYVADWWLDKLSSHRTQLLKEIEGGIAEINFYGWNEETQRMIKDKLLQNLKDYQARQ